MALQSKKALLVGIDDYPNTPLCGCVNDVRAMHDMLGRNGDGSPNFDIVKRENVGTKGELKGLVSDCFSGDADIALFYYSGHGAIDNATGEGCLVTPDCSMNDCGLSLSDVLSIVNTSRCRNRVVLLDCCFSGLMGSTQIIGANSAVLEEGVTILTASRNDETSVEVNGHGVFTALLIEALAGGAADVSGFVTPGGVYAYIDKALGPWDQRPVFKTNVTSFMPLRTVTPQVDAQSLRKLPDYFESPSDTFKLDPSYEPTNDPDDDHELIEPYAVPENVRVFKDLQRFEGVGLVVPVNEEHMYYAAMHATGCRLTALGQHYWRLARDGRI